MFSVRSLILSSVLMWQIPSHAQQRYSPSRGEHAADTAGIVLNTGSLRLTGLNSDAVQLFEETYKGNFFNLKDDADYTTTGAMLSLYLESYGRACPNFVPKDGVELSAPNCSLLVLKPNQFGTTQSCRAYEQQGTGIFADRNLRIVANRNVGTTTSDLLTDIFTNTSKIRSQVHTMRSLLEDTPKLVNENGCASPALRRYVDNLVRFMQKAKPLSLTDLAYIPPVAPPVSVALPLASADFDKMPVKTGPHVVPTNIPRWIEYYRKASQTLEPADRDAFNDIVDRIEDATSARDVASLRHERDRLEQMDKPYKAKCNANTVGPACPPHNDLYTMASHVDMFLIIDMSYGKPIKCEDNKDCPN